MDDYCEEVGRRCGVSMSKWCPKTCEDLRLVRRTMSRGAWKSKIHKLRAQRRENGNWVQGWMCDDLDKYVAYLDYRWVNREAYERYWRLKMEIARRASNIPF